MSNITLLDDWLEWRKACTIERCSDEAAHRLAEFGQARLRGELHRAGCGGLADEYAGEDRPQKAAWCSIEGFLLTNRGNEDADHRSRKTYKHVLLDKREESVAAFEGGLTMLIRQNVVPSIAYGEDPRPRGKAGKPRRYVALDSLDAGEDRHEWLPSDWADAATDADQHMIEQIASVQAGKLIAGLSADQKVVLFCKLSGLPLEAAIQAKVVSCQKSQLAVRYKEVLRALDGVDWEYQVDPQEKYVLCQALVHELKKWAEGPEMAGISTSIIHAQSSSSQDLRP